MTPVIGTLCALGMVVVVPLGLRLLDDGTEPAAGAWARVWPLVGAVGALALVLPRGGLAGGLAIVYAGATAALAVSAVLRLVRRRSLAPVELAVLVALVSPLVAGAALVAERIGVALPGVTPDALAMTVAYAHLAAFAGGLVAALVASAVRTSLASACAIGVPAGLALVLLGRLIDATFVVVAGECLVAAGGSILGWLIWHQVRPAAVTRKPRTLLTIGALALWVGVLLLAWWAAGQVWDGGAWAASSRVFGAVGASCAAAFAVPALLGWHLLLQEHAAARPGATAAPAYPRHP